MLHWILRKIVGSKNQRELKKLWPIVQQINRFEQKFGHVRLFLWRMSDVHERLVVDAGLEFELSTTLGYQAFRSE